MNSQNDAGYTALHHAARQGSKDLIEILLKAGADRMIENNVGETPYMVAQRFHQFEAERLLLNIEQQQGKDFLFWWISFVFIFCKFLSLLETQIGNIEQQQGMDFLFPR